MEEGQIPADVTKLLRRYYEMFDDQAPVALLPWADVRRLIRQALRDGKKLPDQVIPKGAVI